MKHKWHQEWRSHPQKNGKLEEMLRAKSQVIAQVWYWRQQGWANAWAQATRSECVDEHSGVSEKTKSAQISREPSEVQSTRHMNKDLQVPRQSGRIYREKDDVHVREEATQGAIERLVEPGNQQGITSQSQP